MECSWILKSCYLQFSATGVPRQTPQGGGFFFLASLRLFGLSKKNPTPSFFSIILVASKTYDGSKAYKLHTADFFKLRTIDTKYWLFSAQFWLDSLSCHLQLKIFFSFLPEIKILKKQSWGWVFFLASLSSNWRKKKPTPLGGLARNPCNIYISFRKNKDPKTDQ